MYIRIVVTFLVAFFSKSLVAATVVIDFDSVEPFADFPVYFEDGYMLTPNIGGVRIGDAFSSGDNAAQPSFGFGQGIDSSFAFTNDSSNLFSASSIDLLEATVFPDTFGITLIGTKADTSVVSQTLTLDGVAGTETFALSGAFSGLVSLKIAEDITNSFSIDIVAIDDIVLTRVPLPAATWLFGSGLIGLIGFARRKKA